MSHAQTTTSNLLMQLLDLPAPPPVNESDEAEITTKPERPESFYEQKNIPADDAPGTSSRAALAKAQNQP